ncbi:PIG-H family GPI synthesis protein [Aspergillus udagawae]|uniref:Phosphatidylinositol N-acetylglucosaminyltransferase subunit H conserved domain-containing protein n=1 Tax=Aspergillus udagawae TaxID=91492 RepID=A0A8E0UVC7_9EURO|nr:uncharacterized protein Aud_003618 [Aspergillus udagawae]GIC87237.1 hypothetical protein Aud_003618 [Aspergillus udagawae]
MDGGLVEPIGLFCLSHRRCIWVWSCRFGEHIAAVLCVQKRVYRYFQTLGVNDCRTKDSPLFITAEESLLVIRGLGIQTSTSSATYLSKAATRFIPTTQIQDIVIHEAFKGFEVCFYLAVIVEGEPDVVVVFPKLIPRRAILEEVWRGSRRCLYDAKS